MKKAPLGVWGLLFAFSSFAQEAHVSARMDRRQIMVGDQVHLFIDAQTNAAAAKVQWATIPDTFNHLEIVERGKIDTIKQGDITTYRQRLVLTGFDSGVFKVPSFTFSIIPNSGTVYTAQSDSFDLIVQTVAVDTTKGFRDIKGIIQVKSTWRDYIGVIIGCMIFVLLAVFIILYFVRNKKVALPAPPPPAESLQDHTMRLLTELDTKQIWQKGQVKEYYVELTDIVRNYIEARFQTQVMELTTDELLSKARLMPDLMLYHDILADILQTADLAKFAKAQPSPQEHVNAIVKAKQFVEASAPVVVAATEVADNGKDEITSDK